MNTEFLKSISIFIGHFHPLVVHLPIGIIFFLFFLEVIIWFTKNNSLKVVRIYLSFFSMATTLFGLLLGYLLSAEGGYDLELLEKHEHSGQILAGITVAIFLINLFFAQKVFFEKLFKGMVFAAVVALSIVGHYGGSLTHGEDYLALSQISDTKNAEKIFIKDINQAVVFSQLVQPIINQKCISCHNTGKMKGGLRMDSFEEIIKGGENGAIVKVGNSSQSELMKLVNLDPSEERAMPPKGKTPLTSDEKQILAWWIDAGATKDKKVSELKPDAKILTLLKKFEDGAVDETEKLPEVSKIEEKTLAEISQLGININPLSKESNLLDVRCILNKSSWDDKKTASLSKIKDNIYVLELSQTSITNASLKTIAEFKNLNVLFLQNTNLGDSEMNQLQKLEHLEVLNVYGTIITDKSLEVFAKIKNLKKIYIWQTKITQNAVEKFNKKFPSVTIITGRLVI